MTVAGRAASRLCDTTIVTLAAIAAAEPSSSARVTAPRDVLRIFPPPCWRRLWNGDRRFYHRPERRLRIARGVEQQRTVGAGHREAVEPGVVVGDAPGGDRGDARPVEGVEQRTI